MSHFSEVIRHPNHRDKVKLLFPSCADETTSVIGVNFYGFVFFGYYLKV